MAGTPMEVHKALLDAISAGLIVLDRNTRIVGWNAWMESASGHAATAVCGRPVAEVFPAMGSGRLAAAIAAAVETGVSTLVTHALHPRVLPLRTRAGRELLHDIAVSPVYAVASGACLIHVTDVTMAVRRESYLRDRQNARYDAVVASAADVILTVDGEGVIRLANRAARLQFGYTEQELIGRRASILFESVSAWDEMLRAVIDGERLRQPVELLARRKDGSRSYLEVSASRWRDNVHLFVTAILRDANERRAAESALRASEEQARTAARELAELNATLEQRVKERTVRLLEAEAALRQSQKMEALGQLTGGIAHDFNNLLQGIIGSLNMMEKRLTMGRADEIERFLNSALASAERASSLTHRLLAFSRQQPIDPRPVDVNQLIGAMEDLLNRSLGERIRTQIVGSHDLWLVRCDPNQLENALLNLVINARDAMPEGGRLTLATCNKVFDAAEAAARELLPGDHVCITISDSGTGMSAEVQARAFDPFYTTKPIGQGTGLGLSMIYGFVRQSGGSIRLESELGRGTTVEICLPRFAGNLAHDERVPTASAPGSSRRDEVVLLVEDEDIVRLLVVEVLHELGFRVLEAGDGAAAMRILKSAQRIDLLVTDIGLPDLDGQKVAETARADRADLKILFMTGYAESAAGSQFLKDGMHIITKPFTMDKIADKIREMMDT